jgi:hypothetical protein
MANKTTVDERLGKHGKFRPEICAATGQFVSGRHATTINLGDGWFCSVLNKANADKVAIKAEMKKLIPGKARAKAEVKPNDQ